MKSSIRGSRHSSWRQWAEGRLPGGSILIENFAEGTLSKFQDFCGVLVRYGDVSGGIPIVVSTQAFHWSPVIRFLALHMSNDGQKRDPPELCMGEM